MIQIVSDFVVKEEVQGQFELIFGPGGAWSKLFGMCPGFRGTTLFRDTENPRRYLTIDIWDTVIQREQALVEHRTEFSTLEAALIDLIESKTEVGIFRMLAEGTVRARSNTRSNKGGVNRRRSRSSSR